MREGACGGLRLLGGLGVGMSKVWGWQKCGDVQRHQLAMCMIEKGPTPHHGPPPSLTRYPPHLAGMLAGGSGITPMYQVACAILNNPSDRTKVGWQRWMLRLAAGGAH